MWARFKRALRECLAIGNAVTDEYATVIVEKTLKQTTLSEVNATAWGMVYDLSVVALTMGPFMVRCVVCTVFKRTTNLPCDPEIMNFRYESFKASMSTAGQVATLTLPENVETFSALQSLVSEVSDKFIFLMGVMFPFVRLVEMIITWGDARKKLIMVRFFSVEAPTLLCWVSLACSLGISPLMVYGTVSTWLFMRLPALEGDLDLKWEAVPAPPNSECRICLQDMTEGVQCHMCHRVTAHVRCREMWHEQCMQSRVPLTCENCRGTYDKSMVHLWLPHEKRIAFWQLLSHSAMFAGGMPYFLAVRAVAAVWHRKEWRTSACETLALALGLNPLLASLACDGSRHNGDAQTPWATFVPVMSLQTGNFRAVMAAQTFNLFSRKQFWPEYTLVTPAHLDNDTRNQLQQ